MAETKLYANQSAMIDFMDDTYNDHESQVFTGTYKGIISFAPDPQIQAFNKIASAALWLYFQQIYKYKDAYVQILTSTFDERTVTYKTKPGQFVAAADEVFVVTTPEPTAITDAYGIIKIITTEIVDRTVNIKLVVNRVHSADEGKRISERIINIAAQFLGYKVEYLGCIPEDSLVQASVIRQKPFIIVNPTSKPSIYLKHIVGRIEKTEPEINEGVSSFLKKFLGKKKG